MGQFTVAKGWEHHPGPLEGTHEGGGQWRQGTRELESKVAAIWGSS